LPTTKHLPRSWRTEFKSFFPNNAENISELLRLLSAEAYVPGQDLYIEKESDINDDIESSTFATRPLSERNDVIIVARSLHLRTGIRLILKILSFLCAPDDETCDEIIRKLVDIQYETQRH
jgi:excinuclease ABC subunit B